jgi:hypothetical protein
VHLEGDSKSSPVPVRWQSESEPGNLRAVSVSQDRISQTMDAATIARLDRLVLDNLDIQRSSINAPLLSHEPSLVRLSLGSGDGPRLK